MVPPDGVGGEPFVPQERGVILLDVGRGELLDRDLAQGGAQVVFDDFGVAVYRGVRAVGFDDLLHPVIQPVGQGGRAGRYLAVDGPLRLEGQQSFPGLGQGGVGAVGAPALALVVLAAVQVDIIELAAFVVGDVAFNCFSCHVLVSSLSLYRIPQVYHVIPRIAFLI